MEGGPPLFIEGVDLGAVVEEQRRDFLIERTGCRQLSRQVQRSHATVVSGVDIGPFADQKRYTPGMRGRGMQSGSAAFVAGKNVGTAVHEVLECCRPIARCRAEEGGHPTVVPGIDVGASVNEQGEHPSLGVWMPVRAKERRPPPIVPSINLGTPVEE